MQGTGLSFLEKGLVVNRWWDLRMAFIKYCKDLIGRSPLGPWPLGPWLLGPWPLGSEPLAELFLPIEGLKANFESEQAQVMKIILQ